MVQVGALALSGGRAASAAVVVAVRVAALLVAAASFGTESLLNDPSFTMIGYSNTTVTIL